MSSARVSDNGLLEPTTQRKVAAILQDAACHGVRMAIYETYRNRERQIQLYQAGASQLARVGVHHYGPACDIVFLVGPGAGEPSWKGNSSLLGHLAPAHGLVWGGDWGRPGHPTSFSDQDHVQFCTVGQQAALFHGDWYPEQNKPNPEFPKHGTAWN
jgi:hypothetical protein